MYVSICGVESGGGWRVGEAGGASGRCLGESGLSMWLWARARREGAQSVNHGSRHPNFDRTRSMTARGVCGGFVD
jgi:hypothetical protein